MHDTRTGAPTSACLSGSGKSIFTCGDDGSVFVFDVPAEVSRALGKEADIASSITPMNAAEDADDGDRDENFCQRKSLIGSAWKCLVVHGSHLLTSF